MRYTQSLQRSGEVIADRLFDRVPGAGKSTLAFPLTELVNELLGTPTSKKHHLHVDKAQGLISQDSEKDASDKGQIAVSVSLDGWHTTRAELDKMPVCARATLSTQKASLRELLPTGSERSAQAKSKLLNYEDATINLTLSFLGFPGRSIHFRCGRLGSLHPISPQISTSSLYPIQDLRPR